MRLGVLEQNPRARRFWERLGFSAESSRRIRVGVLESVAVRMVRRF
jgi:ribosomal protein S18 acetylase RimI-like enzyme